MTEAAVPVIVEGVTINDDGTATTTLLNPLSGHIFVTNRVGKRVIELCDGQKKVEAIADAIQAEFAGATGEAIRGDVEDFLSQASAQGLIVWRDAA